MHIPYRRQKGRQTSVHKRERQADRRTGEIAVGRHTHSRDNGRQTYCTFMREKGRQTAVQCIHEREVNIQERERQTDIQIRDRKADRHPYSIRRAKGRQTNIQNKERQAETKCRIRKGCGR
jgi:hypothetical protein